MTSALPSLLVVAIALLAGASPGLAQKPASKASERGTFDANGRYVLSEGEQKLDCRSLTGRLQVRIMQLRAELADTSKPTGVAQAMQDVSRPALQMMFGGATAYGSDRNGQLARDRAVLEAYNAQLAAKACPTFDLAAELRKPPTEPPPLPQRPEAAKK